MASTDKPAADAAPAPEPAPADPVSDPRSTEEILANAPPLQLDGGTTIVCPTCGLSLRPEPDENVHGAPCPNCKRPLP